MEKQKIQSMIRNKKLIFITIFLSLFCDFANASQKDSIKINNQFYILQNTDSIGLVNCVDNDIKVPRQYVLQYSKGLKIEQSRGYYNVSVSENSTYPRYITLRKRFSFKRKKIQVYLINPPEPRITLSHFDLETENSMGLLEFQKKNYILLKVPLDYNEVSLVYWLEEFEVIINNGLSIKSSSNLIKLTNADEINSIELTNIKYQVVSCRNNNYSDSILFQRNSP